MNETAPQDPPRPAQDGETQARRDRVDLDHVNVMQQAILERVQREHQRGTWLPRITPLQWALSAVIAAILVAGVFSVVDAGLTAFQKFTEVAMRPQPAPAVEPVQPVDVAQPFTIMVAPESAPAAESRSSSPPQ